MIHIKSQTISDLYEIKKSFGGGGMGLVHHARHRLWNIDVAIKHPRPEFLRFQRQIDDFNAECAKWASLGLDPFVATCYYSREIEGLPCVVAEYLPGGSLQDAIESRALYQGDEDECLSRILTIAASTAWGLARAHRARLIHCDVKPGNMLLTEHGTAKIADFGLAVAFHPSKPDAKAAGLTVVFAPPEQIRGEMLSPPCDVWSWAASVLTMFTGGVTWESGAACGAVLAEFLENGGKEYRIPPMPTSLAILLGECFRFAPNARISDFSEIAERICQCHEKLFGELCPASKPDLELISSDSLNNRAVSRFDLGDIPEVHRLLDEALTVDALHPESNFNSALLGYSSTRKVSQSFLDRLEQVTQFDLGEYRPWLYRACLFNLDGHSREAADALGKAREIAEAREMSEIQRLWDLGSQRKLTPVLAPPISGEDFAQDSARFARLMSKAEKAISEGQLDDARRYLMMSGDISGFSRHPQRRRLLTSLDKFAEQKRGKL
jgi:serine/threonine protein kinase